jgi:hypothetical protein
MIGLRVCYQDVAPVGITMRRFGVAVIEEIVEKRFDWNGVRIWHRISI